MKNQIKISLITLSLVFSGILFSNFSFATNANHSLTLKTYSLMANGTFSWTAAPGAVNYDVTITNLSTQHSSFQQTTQTSIPLTGLPTGRYKIVVKANFADGSSSIVIEDIIMV